MYKNCRYSQRKEHLNIGQFGSHQKQNKTNRIELGEGKRHHSNCPYKMKRASMVSFLPMVRAHSNVIPPSSITDANQCRYLSDPVNISPYFNRTKSLNPIPFYHAHTRVDFVCSWKIGRFSFHALSKRNWMKMERKMFECQSTPNPQWWTLMSCI